MICFHFQDRWNLRVILPTVGRITVAGGSVIGARTVIIWIRHQVPGVIRVTHVQTLAPPVMDMRTALDAMPAITDIGASLSVRGAARTIYVISRSDIVLTALLLVTTEKQTIHAASVLRDVLNVRAQHHVLYVTMQITGVKHVSIRVCTAQAAASLVGALAAT